MAALPDVVVVFAPRWCPTRRLLVTTFVLIATIALGPSAFRYQTNLSDNETDGVAVVLLSIFIAYWWGLTKYIAGFYSLVVCGTYCVRGIHLLSSMSGGSSAIVRPPSGFEEPHTLGFCLLVLCTFFCHRCFYVPVPVTQATQWISVDLVRAPHLVPLKYRILTALYLVGINLTSYGDWSATLVRIALVWCWKCGKYFIYFGAVFWTTLSIGGYIFGPTLVHYIQREHPQLPQEFLTLFRTRVADELQNPTAPISGNLEGTGYELSTVVKDVNTFVEGLTAEDLIAAIKKVSLFCLRRAVFGTLGEYLVFLCLWKTRAEVEAAKLAAEVGGRVE